MKRKTKTTTQENKEDEGYPEFYECMGFTKEEWEAMNNILNY